MAAYRPDIPRHVAEVIRRLPQDIKRVKQALRSLSADPLPGPRLMRERSGLRKFKVRRFRIVYQINRKARLIRIFAVGHRPEVYEELAHQLHEAARPVIKRTRRQRRSSQT